VAIAFKSSGAGAGTEANGVSLDLVCPAVVAANDILIAHVMHTGITTNPTTPSGWSLLYPDPADITVGAPLGTGTATARHWCFGKLAIGTEDGATVGFGTGGGTNGRAGRIYSFDGYVSGTLAEIVPFASFSDIAHEQDPQAPTVITTVAGAKAVALMCQDDDNTHSDITGESGGAWAGYLEFVSSTLGPVGLCLAFMVGTPDVDPGTITGGVLGGANDESGTIGFEIRPSGSQTFQQSLVATALAVAALSTQTTFLRALAATAVGVAALTAVKVFKQALAATAVGVAALSTKLVFKVTMSATAIGTALLTKLVTFRRTLSATALGVAGLATRSTFRRALAAVATAIATVSTEATVAGGAVVRTVLLTRTILFPAERAEKYVKRQDETIIL